MEDRLRREASFANLSTALTFLVTSASQHFTINRIPGASAINYEDLCNNEIYTLQVLGKEIQDVRALAQNGQNLFPILSAFDGPETVRTISLIASILERVQEMQGWLNAFAAFQEESIEVPVPREYECRLYCESLRELRFALAESMNFLQFETTRRVALCTQHPDTIQFCQAALNEWSGDVDLVCVSQPPPQFLSKSPKSLGTESNKLNSFRAATRQISAGFCRPNCKCKCHIAQPRGGPAPLQRALNILFPKAVGLAYLTRCCSILGCRRRNATQGYMTLVIRWYFINRGFLISMMARGLQFNIKLKSYPIIRESSEVSRFVQAGNLDGLKRILSCRQASPNSMTAAFQGCEDIVRFLLSQNADTEVEDVKSRKASHFAKFKALMARASEKDKAISRMFPYQDAFRYDFELTPILTAVLREYDISDTERPDLKTILSVAKSLSTTRNDEDWSIWKRKFRDRSPLFQELIIFFQHTGTDENSKATRLHQLLHQPDCLQQWTPIQWAAFIGRLNDFVQLLEFGANPYTITPSLRNVASHAAECGSHEILSWLCENGYHERGVNLSQPDLWGETPLHIAAAKSFLCTQILLQNGASVESRQGEGMTPLHYVRYLKGEERLNNVRALLDGGANPNAREEGGRTPMYYCLETQDSVEILLSRGADISICDTDGQSMLHYACIQDYPTVLNYLLSRCPRSLMTAEDNKGDSPLLACFQHSRVKCARILLERCPITWITDRNGRTLLHHAVNMGDSTVLRLVLSMPGVDLYAKTSQGQTSEDISKEMGTWDGQIGEILRRAVDKP